MTDRLKRLLTASMLSVTLMSGTACSDRTLSNKSSANGKPDNNVALASNKKATAECAIRGVSIDQDPNGLNVRAEPDKNGKILGQLLPVGDPESHHDDGNESDAPKQRYFGPGFTIKAVSGDWLKIDKIDPKTEGINPQTGDEWIRDNFQGSGWVHFSKVRANFGGGVSGNPTGHAYKGPGYDSGKLLHSADTNLRGVDTVWNDVPRILECNGEWARIEFTQYGESDPETNIWTSYAKDKRKKMIGWMTS
jgi:hypothetical protein